MATMRDYLTWRGDLAFAERPFNDVDALILATLSYLDFGGIVPSPSASRQDGAEGAIGFPTIRGACTALLEKASGDLAPFVKSMATLDEELVHLIGSSERFGPLVLHDYVDFVEEGSSLQFSAVRVGLGEGGPADEYVSFRGTDLSLTGWREDLMLSFTVTRAQEMAYEYLTEVLGEGSSAIVGGHSKGGNLAAYSVADREARKLKNVIRVYSFDGPGMDRSVHPGGVSEAMGERFCRIQPEFSVVGEIFDRKETPRTYVKSTADALMQHDPTSWEVGISGFVCADAIDESASLLNKILATWLDGIEMEDRAAFTRELFDILSAGGATDLSELTKVDNMQRVFAAAAGASDEMKALLGRFAEVGADYARRAAGDAYGKAIAGMQDSAVRGARDLVDVASRKVRSGTSDLVAAWSDFVDSLGRG
ncbi:MAG: DUF2974 domain-containing protein [Olsenella sp.]|nr:DUF2974 domain-containing protein [Olsenella sp.]